MQMLLKTSAIVTFIALTALPMKPEEVQAHKGRMVSVAVLEQDIQTAVQMRSSRLAARAADSLASVLTKEEAYWNRTQLEDAIALSKKNTEAAKLIAKAARASRFDDARLGIERLQANCVACHGSHPENRVPIQN
jgi:hypothetical protein